MKECRQALVEPVSEVDPRAQLKKGYKSHGDALIKQLKSLLIDTVEVKDSTMSTVERLVRKSMNTWLEFGMHRCRIVISDAPWPLSASEKLQRARRGALDFIVMPGLGRYGNADGIELEIFTELEAAQVGS